MKQTPYRAYPLPIPGIFPAAWRVEGAVARALIAFACKRGPGPTVMPPAYWVQFFKQRGFLCPDSWKELTNIASEEGLEFQLYDDLVELDGKLHAVHCCGNVWVKTSPCMAALVTTKAACGAELGRWCSVLVSQGRLRAHYTPAS